MAGSWNHAVWHVIEGEPFPFDEVAVGQLRDNEDFVEMVDNLGDAFETVEEMYGMVWWLAHQIVSERGDSENRQEHLDVIESARQNYQQGVRLGGAVPLFDEAE